MDLQPLSVFLVKNGQGGDRILFRYPYSVSKKTREIAHQDQVPYSTVNPRGADNDNGGSDSRLRCYRLPEHFLNEDILNHTSRTVSNDELTVDTLPEYPSKVLSNLLAVHRQFCDTKFELKINDVRFVGHPVNLEVKHGEQQNYARDITCPFTMFQVVFALRAVADYSVVEVFNDLSKQIGTAIKSQERCLKDICIFCWLQRSHFLEEAANHSEDQQTNISPYAMAVDGPRSTLAKSLKIIFEDISHRGICYERIQNTIEISFCFPQKVFRRLNPCLDVKPEAIFNCLKALRPYHGILLLYETNELLDKLPLDAVPTLKKMILYAAPTKSLRTIASDSDIALPHVFRLASHLLYWGLAIVIFPICESNIYVVSPKINSLMNQVVKEAFNDKFPGENLVACLSMFSLPTSIAQRTAPIMNSGQLQLFTRIIVWMLQQHLLLQLHTYVTLALNDDMKCVWQDPVEKRKLDKKPILLERDDILKQELDQDVDSILSAFSSTDRQAILDISTDKEELAKFAKVAVYMNGKYHVEEIMYHMDLRRAQLLAFVDKFRDIIVRHEHEDPALTMYYEPINRG